jgi:hypothetical protein
MEGDIKRRTAKMTGPLLFAVLAVLLGACAAGSIGDTTITPVGQVSATGSVDTANRHLNP